MAATPQYLAELGAMIDQDRFEEVYDKLKRPDGDYSNMDLELMWRLARACRFLGTGLRNFANMFFFSPN